MTDKKTPLPHHHHDTAVDLKEHMPDDATIASVSAAMKQLGDPTRLKIFWILCHCEECVINIAAMMEMSSPAVSHHLSLLKSSGLIVARRSGKEMFYTAADTELAQALHHIIEDIARISCPR